jgi:type II secretion system protein C
MTRTLFALVAALAVLAPRAGRAEPLTVAPDADCKPARPGQLLRVSLKPGSTVKEALGWAARLACRGFRIESDLAGRAVTLTAPVDMTLDQSRALLRATLSAAGLVAGLGKGGLVVRPDGHRPRRAPAPAPDDAPTMALKSKLVATVLGAEPARAAAAFRDAKGRQVVVALGSRVEGATLVAVEPQRVTLRRGKKVGVVGFGPAGEVAAPVDTTINGIDLRDAVKSLGAQRWEITKRAAQVALKDPKATLRLVKITPEWRDQKVYGWRLSGFRRDSLPAKLGVRSGDVLLAVNGRSLVDPDQALAIYLTLRGAEKVVVTLERDGKKLDLEYLVR